MNRIIEAIDRVHKKLIDVEASTTTSSGNNSNTEDQQKILRLGELTLSYEGNIHTLTNYLPNVPDIDLKRYPSYYSRMEETTQREVSEYEDMMTIATDNAAKAGLTNPKQEMEEYSKQCKQAYLQWLEERRKVFSKIKTVIHSDGTITSTNTETGEKARFTTQFEFIE